MVYYIAWRSYVSTALPSWDKSYLVMAYNPIYSLVVVDFFEDFYIYIHKDIVL